MIIFTPAIMSRTTFFILFCLLQLRPGAQNLKPDQFILTGKIINSEHNYVYLGYVDVTGKEIRDSCLLESGNFYFKGNIKEPTMAYLKGNLKFMDDAVNPNITNLYLEPGEMFASVTYNNFKQMKLSGSNTQLEFEKLNTQYAAIDKNSDSLYEKYSEVNHRFILDHPDSYVSVFQLLLYETRWPLDSVKRLYSHLSPRVRGSSYGTEIQQTINEIDENSEGKMAKEFRTIDLYGDSVHLSSFKTKYVLLDFWGSWCAPCRQSTPHLIALFKKYHSRGLEVIAVAEEYDDTGNAWKEAIKKDGTHIWYNVLSGKTGKEKNVGNPQSIVKQFGVRLFPTKILIDRSGTIIGRYDGNGDEAALDKKLAEVFE